MIKAHNEKRALHGSPNVAQDNALCKTAQKWAEHMSGGNFAHSGGSYGENIAMSSE